ncbi:hypothetical protein [Pontibacter ruber]|nr:hypothetical protein [Pontibacter ruber]
MCMTFGIMCGATAKGNTNTSVKKENATEKNEKAAATENKAAAIVELRANKLTDDMIRELRLNNYQAKKLRAINMDKVAKMKAIEDQFAGNQQLIDAKCKAVCDERDSELEAVLSTVQYNHYFGDRKIYSKRDKEFVASLSAPAKEQNKAKEQLATSGSATEATTATVN